MNKTRRNAIYLDSSSDDQVCSPFLSSKRTQPEIDASIANDTLQQEPPVYDSPRQISSSSSEGDSDPEAEEYRIRIGRRTVEDDEYEDAIPTQCIVVAEVKSPRVLWLAVATWQLNGLRICGPDAGDVIKESELFHFSTHLDPDPYYFARNALSPSKIRRHLLELVSQGELKFQPETLDDAVAQRQRDEASWAKLAEDTGDFQSEDEDAPAWTDQPVEKRFPHPWALPVAPARSHEKFPQDLPGFSASSTGSELSSIDVIATFVNNIDDRDLNLEHYIQVAFDSDETLKSAKEYFLQGDGSADFRGIGNNRHLARQWWQLELWVLPQMNECSTLFKWDDVPELPGFAFCDLDALTEGQESRAKLYVEVHIVLHPEHIGVANEGATGPEGD